MCCLNLFYWLAIITVNILTAQSQPGRCAPPPAEMFVTENDSVSWKNVTLSMPAVIYACLLLSMCVC